MPNAKRRQPLDGLLLLDKAAGWSSNQALKKAQYLLNAAKAGHCGTLDPMATGLLPVVLGEATKFSNDLLEADKTYQATLLLGVRTDSGDAEGRLIETRPVAVERDAWDRVAAAFTGDIRQVPPMHSALKRDGKPLYEYARAGIEVERQPRAVRILSLETVEFAVPRVTIRVRCSKGTYIRTLADDMGQALGCGAHLVALRRERIADLDIAQAIDLEALQALDPPARQARVRPLDSLLRKLEALSLDVERSRRFRQGQRIRVREAAESAPQPRLVRIYSEDPLPERLLGIAIEENGLLTPRRVLNTNAFSGEST